MTDEDRRLSGAYAANALSDDERAAHEALIRSDPEVAEETRSLLETVAELSKASEQAPPAYLRANVLNAIKSVRPLPPIADDAADAQAALADGADPSGAVPRATDPAPQGEGSGPPAEITPVADDVAEPIDLAQRRSRRSIGWLSGIAAAAAAAIVAVFVVVGQQDDAPVSQADSVISASDVTSQIAKVDDWSATLYQSKSQDSAVLYSDEMPDAPDGKDFQVWLMQDDGTITSAGVMPRTNGGTQEYVIDGDLANARAVAVSEEPAGGSIQPTTEPLLMIELT